jgi:hypothetical protein
MTARIIGEGGMFIDTAQPHRTEWRKLGIALVLATIIVLMMLLARLVI